MSGPSRPNVILFFTDQQRWDSVGAYGASPLGLTPNLDALAARGTLFEHAFTCQPVCAPARACLQTGHWATQNGVWRNQIALDATQRTLGHWFRDAGYRTGYIGKWHLGPADPGNDYDCNVPPEYRTGYDDWLASDILEFTSRPYGGTMFDGDGQPVDFSGYRVDALTDAAISRIEGYAQSSETRPFFLTVSFIAPHPPLVPPAPYMERYLRADLPDPVIGDWACPPEGGGLGLGQSSSRVDLRGEALRAARAGYYGLINHVDDQLNRLLNPVNGIDRQTDNNTIVLLTSDHGEMLGDHFLWRKSVPYEPSARIPFLVRAPERLGLESGAVVDEPTCLEDLMPTVLEMAGVDVPDTVEGRSVLPLLRAEQTTWRPHLHLEHAPMHHTLTDGREKYIWFAGDGREQVFDLVEDADERRDLADSAEHAERLGSWRLRLIEELAGRPEGFTDGSQLIPGRPYPPVLGSG